MRAPVEIHAPPFPRGLRWLNVASLRMDQQRGRPVLLEFWDFCRVNSLRTLPYLKAWHERYAPAGLRVIGVHTGGFPASREEDAIARAVERLQIPYPVVVDSRLEIWDLYGNKGWPARYLWDAEQRLHSYHYGEGAYAETEGEIQELLGVRREPVAPIRPEEDPAATLAPQTLDQPGAYCGPYAAGGVWAVLDGHGTALVNGEEIAVDGIGCYPLIEYDRHTEGVLRLELGPGVTCLQTCFTPGVAPAPRAAPAPHPAGRPGA